MMALAMREPSIPAGALALLRELSAGRGWAGIGRRGKALRTLLDRGLVWGPSQRVGRRYRYPLTEDGRRALRRATE
jgi:hypothetical protein